MIYGYGRVSTVKQANGNSLEAQERELRANGAEEVYLDAYTGTKAARPKFDILRSKLKTGDTLVVTKLDRIARSSSQGVKLIEELLDQGVVVNVLNMGKMDNTPTGKLIRTIMLAFAEFERDMIVERTQEGKAIAKGKEGFKDGRPKKYSKKQINHAMQLLGDNSYTQVAEMTGISKATLYREHCKYKKQMEIGAMEKEDPDQMDIFDYL